MNIKFICHATFTINLADGRKIIIDPYQPHTFNGRFDYDAFRFDPDFALITHEHIDHNYLGDLTSIPVVVRNEWADKSLRISSMRVWHDKFEGRKFGGSVSMKFIEAEGLRICHMGDCGEMLTDEQIQRMGQVDILLIPVGGFYTMDGNEAAIIAQKIHARTTIPCHYATAKCSLPITGPDVFLSHFGDITELQASSCDAHQLPQGVVVMKSEMLWNLNV